MSGKIAAGLTCPACGGQINLEEGEGLAFCKFCGSFFALDAEEGVSKIIYRMEKTADEAKAAVKAWMKNGNTAKKLETRAEFTGVSAAYLPFWRLIARGKACICGLSSGRSNTPQEALINREYIYSELACEAGDLGIRTVRIPENARAVVADTAGLPAFPVTVSKDECRKNGCEAIMEQAITDGTGDGGWKEADVFGFKFKVGSPASANLPDRRMITFSKAFCIPKGFSLIYYPFYIVRYDYQGKSYTAAVDGIAGNIVSGRAPGNTGRQSWFAGICGAAAGTITGIGTAFVSAPVFPTDSMPFIIAVSAVFYGIAAILITIAWKQFRNGGEVLSGFAKGRGIARGKQISMVETVPGGMFDYGGR